MESFLTNYHQKKNHRFIIPYPQLVNLTPIHIKIRSDSCYRTPPSDGWTLICVDPIKIGGRLQIDDTHFMGYLIKIKNPCLMHDATLKYGHKSPLYSFKFKDSEKITLMSKAFKLLNNHYKNHVFKIKHITEME